MKTSCVHKETLRPHTEPRPGSLGCAAFGSWNPDKPRVLSTLRACNRASLGALVSFQVPGTPQIALNFPFPMQILYFGPKCRGQVIANIHDFPWVWETPQILAIKCSEPRWSQGCL